MTRTKSGTVRKDGRIAVRKTIDGNIKYFYGKTRKEAEKKRDEFVARLRFGFEKPKKAQDYFSVVADRWLELVQKTVEDRTFRDYRVKTKYAKEHFKMMRISEITPGVVQSYLNTYKGKSKNTLNVHRVVLRGIFRLAEDDFHSKPPSLDRVKNPKTAVKISKKWYSKEEAEKVNALAEESRHGLFAYVILNTGMRSEEAAAIHIRDFDFKKGILHVRSAVHPSDGRQILDTTKTEKSTRDIYLREDFAAHIKEMGFTGYLFDNGKGKPRNLSNIRNRDYKKFKQEIADAFGGEIPALNPHELRHTFGALLYDASKDLRLVMEQLGHTTLAAAQIYIHQPPEQDKRDAVNRIF